MEFELSEVVGCFCVVFWLCMSR